MEWNQYSFVCRGGAERADGWRMRLAWWLRRLAAWIDGSSCTITLDWASNPSLSRKTQDECIYAGLGYIRDSLQSEHNIALQEEAFARLYPELAKGDSRELEWKK